MFHCLLGHQCEHCEADYYEILTLINSASAIAITGFGGKLRHREGEKQADFVQF